MAFNITGLSSGLDWSTMISQLVALQRKPITNLEDRQTTLSEKKSAWAEVNTMLLTLKTTAGSLSSLDDFDRFTPNASIAGTSSDVEDLLSFSVGSNASEGTYSIKVNQLATAQKLVSSSFSSSSVALGISGGISVNGREVSIATTDSLADIRTKINALNSGENPAGVTASIIAVSDSEYRLTLTSKDTGVDGMSITDNTGGLGLTELVAGQDAEIMVDGFTITRSTNQIGDVISGVTLNLVGDDPSATVTLNLNRDNDGIKEKIREFVDGYNKLMSYIEKQSTVSDGGKTTATLFADSSLRSVKTALRSAILSGVNGLDSTLDHLSRIGINIDRYGQLSIDDKTLDGYLDSNFAEVVNLFAAHGTSSSSELSYVYSGNAAAAGDYDVEITQVATKASTQGTGFSGTLTSGATLTLTSSGGTEENISLTSGMDMDAIVDAINTGNTLGITAENIGGQLSISSRSYGSSGNFTVSGISAELGIADSTYSGDDVAGRIRAEGSSDWMTMTGRGQLLTGDADQDVDGLVIRYTGTTPTTPGSLDFSFIQGVAKKLENALHSMTDSIDGYVATKQKTLQSQMDKIDKKIENMEVRLARYQETLMAKYSAMESMLSILQSQQSWLEGQIKSLSGSSD